MTKKTSNRFSPEVRERAVRIVLEHGDDHTSQWAAMSSIASKIGWVWGECPENGGMTTWEVRSAGR